MGDATTPVMATQAGDAGAFARFDLSRVPSPAFVVDAARVRANLAVLRAVADAAGIELLAALKAFSFWAMGSEIGGTLDGVCASGLYEARLGREHFGGTVATYCAGYKLADLPAICQLSDHVVFNSPMQHDRARPVLDAARASGATFDVGLRINPLHAEGSIAKYDPCQPHSRLGFPVDQLRPEHLDGVRGLHFHSLCEQDFEPLARTWDALEPTLRPFLPRLSWLNMGGGHHITRADYQRDALVAFLTDVRRQTGLHLILEPGEAVALDAGILVGELIDVIDNGMPVGICDISATCHMPDVIEAPYRPAMLGEAAEGPVIRLGGPSCLAGDIIGDFRLPRPWTPGQRFAFLDQAHYSMVKTTMFNGVPLPDIWLWDSATDDLRRVRSFGYEDFRDRLG